VQPVKLRAGRKEKWYYDDKYKEKEQ